MQILTAARGGELHIMRPKDLDITEKVWVYKPASHKTQHHGHERTIYLGERAQDIIKPFLKGRRLDAYLFDPREAGGKAGDRATQDRYDAGSYGVAIKRACIQAFPPPEPLQRRRIPNPGSRKKTRIESAAERNRRLTPAQREELEAWTKAHHWHPHQLRHTAATQLRKTYGIEAARIILGHRAPQTTEIYAEANHEQAMSIAGKVG